MYPSHSANYHQQGLGQILQRTSSSSTLSDHSDLPHIPLSTTAPSQLGNTPHMLTSAEDIYIPPPMSHGRTWLTHPPPLNETFPEAPEPQTSSHTTPNPSLSRPNPFARPTTKASQPVSRPGNHEICDPAGNLLTQMVVGHFFQGAPQVNARGVLNSYTIIFMGFFLDAAPPQLAHPIL
jgi:hypothetical protein